jgi:hypothetical protein
MGSIVQNEANFQGRDKSATAVCRDKQGQGTTDGDPGRKEIRAKRSQFSQPREFDD